MIIINCTLQKMNEESFKQSDKEMSILFLTLHLDTLNAHSIHLQSILMKLLLNLAKMNLPKQSASDIEHIINDSVILMPPSFVSSTSSPTSRSLSRY